MMIYQPKPEDRSSYGLWAVGSRGRDTFDRTSIASRELKYKILDQLTIEILLDVR